jgi:hypothetical protein
LAVYSVGAWGLLMRVAGALHCALWSGVATGAAFVFLAIFADSFRRLMRQQRRGA